MAICSNKTRMVGSSRQMTKGASCIYRKRLLSFMLKSSCQPPRNRDSLDRFLLILISFQPEHISACQARCISQARIRRLFEYCSRYTKGGYSMGKTKNRWLIALAAFAIFTIFFVMLLRSQCFRTSPMY